MGEAPSTSRQAGHLGLEASSFIQMDSIIKASMLNKMPSP